MTWRGGSWPDPATMSRRGRTEFGHVMLCVPAGGRGAEGGAMGTCRSGSALLALTLVLGVLTSPLAAQAPPAGKTYRIGWLSPASAENGRPNLDALRQGLRQLGYAEGRNITIELRWADSATDRLAELGRAGAAQGRRHLHRRITGHGGGEGRDRHDSRRVLERGLPGSDRARG